MENTVIHNPGKNRFELATAAGPAIADYRLADGVMTIYHTEVPVPLRGQGFGRRLVEGTLSHVRRMNLKVVPSCWFVRDFIQQNPEFKDLMA